MVWLARDVSDRATVVFDTKPCRDSCGRWVTSCGKLCDASQLGLPELEIGACIECTLQFTPVPYPSRTEEIWRPWNIKERRWVNEINRGRFNVWPNKNECQQYICEALAPVGDWEPVRYDTCPVGP